MLAILGLFAIWPRAAIDRPLVLAHGLAEASLVDDFAARRVLGVALDDDQLIAGVRWGAGERVELDAAAGVTIDGARPDLLRVAIAWRARAGDLDVAPTARLDGCVGCGFSILRTAAIGAPLRWRVADRVYLHAGRELLPMQIRPFVALDLSARAGAGVQLTDMLAAEVDAELARVTIAGQQRDDRWLAHAPVVVSALASIAPRLDLGIAIGADEASAPRDGWRASVMIAGRTR